MRSPQTFFISDLHLHSSRPSVTEHFIHFLQNEAQAAEALYILGDFFEFWAGDDDPNPHYQKVIAALAKFSSSGIPLYFMRGNRDFLIGKAFAKATGCILLDDPSVIELYGERILLAHGDSLCTDDRAHQRFRKISQHPVIRQLFLWLPFSWRHKIANSIRQKSQKTSSEREKRRSLATTQTTHSVHQTNNSPNTYRNDFDVNQTAVEEALRQTETNILIHGHTHIPGIHEFDLAEGKKKRIVLGEWGVQGSVFIYSKDAQILKAI